MCCAEWDLDSWQPAWIPDSQPFFTSIQKTAPSSPLPKPWGGWSFVDQLCPHTGKEPCGSSSPCSEWVVALPFQWGDGRRNEMRGRCSDCMCGLGIILRGPSKKRARIGTAGASSGVLPKYQLGLWTTFKWQSRVAQKKILKPTLIFEL